MSILTQTDLPEDGKPAKSSPPLLALEPDKPGVFQSSVASLVSFMPLWGFPDCTFNCLLNGVDKHIIICKKRGLIMATRLPMFCSLNLFREVLPPGSRIPVVPANSGSLPITRTWECPWWGPCHRVKCRGCKQLAQIYSFSIKTLLLEHLPADWSNFTQRI